MPPDWLTFALTDLAPWSILGVYSLAILTGRLISRAQADRNVQLEQDTARRLVAQERDSADRLIAVMEKRLADKDKAAAEAERREVILQAANKELMTQVSALVETTETVNRVMSALPRGGDTNA